MTAEQEVFQDLQKDARVQLKPGDRMITTATQVKITIETEITIETIVTVRKIEGL